MNNNSSENIEEKNTNNNETFIPETEPISFFRILLGIFIFIFALPLFGQLIFLALAVTLGKFLFNTVGIGEETVEIILSILSISISLIISFRAAFIRH